MKTKQYFVSFTTAVMALSLTQVAQAEEQNQNGSYKLPPQTRYLSDEQVTNLSGATEKIEIQPNEYTPGALKFLHAEVKTTFGTTSYERQILDITQSYFGLTVGDKVDEAINNFSKYAGDRKLVVGLNVKASLTPFLLESSAKKKVHAAVFEKVKQGAMAAAAMKVKAGFEQQVYPLVQAGKLTEEEYQAMLATNISKTTNAVSHNTALLNALAEPHLEKADERIEAVAQEILLQEVSLKFAWSPLAEDKLIIFGTVGKAQVNGNLKQGLRAVTAFGGWANIGATTQGTGTVQMGVQTAVLDDIKVTLESWVFHNRLPTRSGQTLLFNVVSMPDDVFHNHQDITRLDSNMQKITVEMPSKIAPTSDTVYVMTGDFNGNRAYGGGAIVRVLPKISLQVEGMVGRQVPYHSAVMEAILYHATDKLTLFLANENVNSLMSPYQVANAKTTPGQLGSVAVGAGYTIGKWDLGHDVKAAINAMGEFRCFYQNKGMYDTDACGVDAGLSGQVSWQ